MLKDIKDYSAEEVGLWVTAQGLDPSKFVSEGVDGDLLLSLSVDDLKNDLGLSSLQAKKVMKNIEFSKNLAGGSGGGGDDDVEWCVEHFLGQQLEWKVHFGRRSSAPEGWRFRNTKKMYVLDIQRCHMLVLRCSQRSKKPNVDFLLCS